MHDTAPGPGWRDDWRTQARREVRYHLEGLEGRSVRAPVRQVRRALRELVALEGLPLAVTHGDYQPYNWRSRSRRDLSVFDFGQAALRPAVHDLTRLRYSVCWGRPQLLESFISGYGRPLSEDERRYLELSLVIRATIGLNLGELRGRPVMVEHARRVLRQSR